MQRCHLKPVLVFIGLVVVCPVVLGLTFAAHRDGRISFPGGSGNSTASDDTVAELLRVQSQIVARLDRLETTRAQRAASPAAMATRGQGRRDNRNGASSMSAAEIAASQAAAMRHREDAFVNEPLSAAWAQRSERAITSALSAASLARENATAPVTVESACHSQTCRISMAFDDDLKASFTKVVFLEQIGEALPQAEIFEQANPDGGVRLVVYARRGDAATRQ